MECIVEDELRAIARKTTRRRRCTFCRNARGTVGVPELAEVMAGPLRTYLAHGECEPRYGPDDERPDYVQRGDSLADAIVELTAVSDDVASALAEALATLDPYDGHDPSSERFFSLPQQYVRGMFAAPADELSAEWSRFARHLKHTRRFFDPEAATFLRSLLGEPTEFTNAHPAVVVLGPNGTRSTVVRAREADSEQHAADIIAAAASDLDANPKARAGRMNAHGIVVFYGSFSEDTAIHEVRPSVGSLVVTGKFEIVRDMRLLDLSRLANDVELGSIFDPERPAREAKQQFLHHLHELLSRPVHRNDEPLEYLPTQVFSDYVSNVLNLDGIIFASAQVGALLRSYEHDRELDPAHCNVALFAGPNRLRFWSYVEGSARPYTVSAVQYRYSWQSRIGRAHSTPTRKEP